MSWVPDQDSFLARLNEQYGSVQIQPLDESLDSLELSDVTHWIVDPAPQFKISTQLIEKKFPCLRFIGSPSTGVTHIEKQLTNSGDIAVKCLQDIPAEKLANITASSEFTLFAFLSLVRKAKTIYHCDLKEWRDNLNAFRGRQVNGMKVLIFGCGRIGGNVGRYLTAMGASVSYYEPDPSKHQSKFEYISHETLESRLKGVDAVFLCFHWSPDNTSFFGKKFIDAMKDDAFFVNTSRGENVDEAYLIQQIVDGKFAGVALDVLKDEQSDGFRNHPLLKLEKSCDRLIISPHIAGASIDSERLAFEYVLELARKFP